MNQDNVFGLKNPAVANEVRDALTAVLREGARTLLAQAIEALRAPGDRMVLGPASDGGYYLIGLKHPYQQLFARIAWGTETVARATCERAAEIGLATTLLPEWYDVDDLKTLRWLQDELFGHASRFRGGGFAAASRAFLKDAPQIKP